MITGGIIFNMLLQKLKKNRFQFSYFKQYCIKSMAINVLATEKIVLY